MKNWSEQKEGPRWKFYLQYILAWGIVNFLCLFFLLKLIKSNFDLRDITYFLVIFPLAFILAFVITHLVYTTNEKKMKMLQEKISQP